MVNLRNQSPCIFENIMKLCSHLSEDEVYNLMTKYKDTFVERFTKFTIDLADSTEVTQND